MEEKICVLCGKKKEIYEDDICRDCYEEKKKSGF